MGNEMVNESANEITNEIAKVGLVICNYNKEKDVLECIQDVFENRFEDIMVYVVDNGSKDQSVKLIKEKYEANPRLVLIENKENLGGSGGFNTGLRMAFANMHPYLMCVDNDAFLDENCIGSLYEFLENNADTGIAAAKILNRGMEEYIQQYGSTIDFKNYEVDSFYCNHHVDEDLPEVVYSDAVPACALMIRRSLVEEIGFMPEENFLYWDDTEWCLRCKAAGYKVASIGKALAVHAMGAKKEDVNTFPTYYAWRNWIVFFLNHIEEAQLDSMAEEFLGAIFDILYSGLYRGEPNMATTIMAALDDALHKKMGKAGPERIFDLEDSYKGIISLFNGKSHIYIEEKEFPLMAKWIKDTFSNEKGPVLSLSSQYTRAEAAAVVGVETDCVIELCQSIFLVEDLSLSKYYVDLDGNVLETEDQVLQIINYNYSKRAFVFAQKALFVRLARENYFNN